MPTIRKNRANLIRRNDRCPCGSNAKYKHCCSPDAVARVMTRRMQEHARQYIDSGEEAIRWVIVDGSGRRFFVDKDGRILVFNDKHLAHAIVQLEEFNTQAPGEINVAGVGPTKWQHLQDTLPFVDVADIESAAEMVRERIAAARARLEAEAAADEHDAASSVGEDPA